MIKTPTCGAQYGNFPGASCYGTAKSQFRIRLVFFRRMHVPPDKGVLPEFFHKTLICRIQIPHHYIRQDPQGLCRRQAAVYSYCQVKFIFSAKITGEIQIQCSAGKTQTVFQG